MIDTISAMPNAHSHAFQRDLRGVGERHSDPSDDFWTWRTEMFRLAGALTPERMADVAGRVYREMAAAGYWAVGEFHYVVHQPDGTPYEQPNVMAMTLADTAREAGLEITLLPAAYHRNGWDGGDRPPEPGQRRFCDATVEGYLTRVDALREWAEGRDGVHVGVAAHSVRAVPREWLAEIARYADTYNLVRHVHAHEQVRELEECAAEHDGVTPIALLRATGFLGPRTSVVHGIHVTDADVAHLGETDTIVVTCPTTEGNLGDGHFPAMRYLDAGVRMAIGSDSNVRVDPFEEAREMETLARRERRTRAGLLSCYSDLWAELVSNGRRSLGLEGRPDAMAAIDRHHPQLAGVANADLPRALVTAASSAVVRGLA